MARNWGGFHPQNELIKLYWEALEISQSEQHRILKSFAPTSASEPEDTDEETEPATNPGLLPIR